MKIISPALILALCLSLVNGQKLGTKKVGIPSVIGLGCFNCADNWNFGCGVEKMEKNCRCNSKEFLGTTLNCINRFASGEEEIIWGYSYLETFCHFNSNNTMNYAKMQSIYTNATKFIVHPPSKDTGKRLYNPVDASAQQFRTEYNAASTAKNQYKLGTIYGLMLILYWLIIMLVATVAQFLKSKYPDTLNKMNSPGLSKFRKAFCLPALFGENHMRPVNCLKMFNISAPSRGQTIIVAFYIFLNIVFLVSNYQVYLPNPYLATKKDQLLRYVGNRTGIIAFTQLPLIVLFAARNNPFERLTGWSFNSFQVYHHWVARMMILHSFIHGVCFTVIAVEGQTASFRWEHVRNWRFGNTALYVSIAMLVVAFRVFRQRAYEFFVAFHKLAFIVFLVGLWYHCVDFGWMVWLYITLAFYLTERFIRICRLLYSGGLTLGKFWLADDGTIKVSLAYSSRWRPRAGNFIYVRILSNGFFWQAHPFTIYESPSPEENGNIQLRIRPKNGMTRQLADLLLKLDPGEKLTLTCLMEGPYGCSQPMDQYNSNLIVTGGIGVTSAYSYASSLVKIYQATGREYSVTFLWVIQTPDTIAMFENELKFLLAYPDIVTVRVYITKSMFKPPVSPLAYIPDGLSKRYNDHGMRKKTDIKTSVEETDEADIITPRDMCRQSRSMATIAIQVDELSPSSSNDQRGNNRFDYTTIERPPSAAKIEQTYVSSRTITPQSTIFEKDESIDLGSPWIYYSKPSIRDEVENFIRTSSGTKGITTCGPPSFVDQVRYSVVQNILQTIQRVDYFEEVFSW